MKNLKLDLEDIDTSISDKKNLIEEAKALNKEIQLAQQKMLEITEN